MKIDVTYFKLKSWDPVKGQIAVAECRITFRLDEKDTGMISANPAESVCIMSDRIPHPLWYLSSRAFQTFEDVLALIRVWKTAWLGQRSSFANTLRGKDHLVWGVQTRDYQSCHCWVSRRQWIPDELLGLCWDD